MVFSQPQVVRSRSTGPCTSALKTVVPCSSVSGSIPIWIAKPVAASKSTNTMKPKQGVRIRYSQDDWELHTLLTVSCRRLRFIVDVLQLWNASTTLKMSNGAYSVRNECGWWSGTLVWFLHVSPRKMIPRNASIPNPSRNVTNNRTDGVILIEHTYNTMNFKEVKNWSRYRDSRSLAPFSSTFSIPSKDHLKLQIRNSWHTTLSHESW